MKIPIDEMPKKQIIGKDKLRGDENAQPVESFKTYCKGNKTSFKISQQVRERIDNKHSTPNQPRLYFNFTLPFSIFTFNTRAGGGTDYQFFTLRGFQEFYMLFQDFTLRLYLNSGPFKAEISGSLTFPDIVGYCTWGPGGETSQEKELQKEWDEWEEKTGYLDSYFEHYLVDLKAGIRVLKRPEIVISTGLEWYRLDNGVFFDSQRYSEWRGYISPQMVEGDVLAFTYHSKGWRFFNEIELGWIDHVPVGTFYNSFTLGCMVSSSQRPGYYLRFTSSPHGLLYSNIFGGTAEFRWSPDEWLFRSSATITLRLF